MSFSPLSKPMPPVLRAGLLFLFLLPVFHGFSQSLDLARAAATCIPSAAGSAANLRSFSANQPAIELPGAFFRTGCQPRLRDFHCKPTFRRPRLCAFAIAASTLR